MKISFFLAFFKRNKSSRDVKVKVRKKKFKGKGHDKGSVFRNLCQFFAKRIDQLSKWIQTWTLKTSLGNVASFMRNAILSIWEGGQTGGAA